MPMTESAFLLTYRRLAIDLEKCILWANQNCMTFNASKTVFIRFSYTTIPTSIYFAQKCIMSSSSTKDLGVIISSDLSWNEHISSKLRNCYGIFINLKRCIPFHSAASLKLRLYHIYILPTLLYASEIWAPNVTQLFKLERFQARVLAWCVPGNSYNHRMKVCGVLPISLQIQMKALVMFNKLLNDCYDFPIYNYILLSYNRNCHYNLRDNTRPVFIVPRTKRHRTDTSFIVRAAKWAVVKHVVISEQIYVK